MKRFCLLIILLLPVLVTAEPMFIRFDEMIAKSKTIVVARYLADSSEFQFRLRVESVLKGAASDSIITVGRAYGKPYVNEKRSLIAFINERNEWEWVGEGDDLENGMIVLNGFYDFNAYGVSPAGITMAQLKQYLKEKKFDGTMEGNLEFPDYIAGRSEKTNTHFSISYTYYPDEKINYKVSATGLPLVDFKNDPKVYIGGNTVFLEYEENMVRPLQINGEADSVYAGGKNFHVRFGIEEPRDIDSSHFYEYLAHPEYGPQYYELEITLSDSTKYTLVYGDEYGRIGYLMYGGRRIECTSSGQSTEDTKGGFTFGIIGGENEIEISLDLLPNEERFKPFFGNSGSDNFMPSLQTAPWQGDFSIMKNGKAVSTKRCTVSLKKTLFSKNENYRK